MNASKIIRKQAINKAKSSFNDKLKKVVKSETQRELIQNDNKNDSNNINFTDKAINKFASVGSKAVALLPLKWIAIGLACLLLLLLSVSAISCVSSIASVGANVSPNISPEVKEKIVKLMEDLDSSCGKKLSSNFTIEGSTETDWRTVLSLLFGYYKNNLNDFNENVGGSSWKSGDVSENGLNMIKTHEGFSSIPYNLGDGTLTIGFGTTSRYDPINYYKLAPKCTELQASTVLQKTLKENYANQVLFYIKKSGREVTQYQFDALVSFQYNEGSIQDEKFWKMWCSGASVEAVAKQMEITKIGFGGGVVTRRKAEAHLFLSGEYPPVSIHDYGTGTTITTTSSVNSNSGIINKIYELINVVSPDHAKLNRKSFVEAVHELNFDEDQVALANALYEGDMWSDTFGEDYDFSFKINGSFSGGGNSGNVTLVNGERKGNQKIIDLAMGELGNNGDKYTDWYQIGRGTPYCNIFVTWLMYNTSDNLYNGSYPSKTECNDAYTVATSEWFKSQGRWGNRDYDKLVAGDVIYFDWDGGGVDHVGIVKAVDNDWITTIEGNSTNALVCENKYRRDSSVIYGFGLMNY